MNPRDGLVVLYGGTFDPFHTGHEAICRKLLENPEVIELRLIPCAIPALKEKASASPEARLEMLSDWRLTQEDQNRIVVDDIEIRRKGSSYTIDTIEACHKKELGGSLVFALGSDAWNSLPKWHRSAEIIKRVGFWVFHRAGEAKPDLHEGIEQIMDAGSFSVRPFGKAFFDSSVSVELSSSDIRAGQNQQSALPPAISDYIYRQGLYQHRKAPINV